MTKKAVMGKQRKEVSEWVIVKRKGDEEEVLRGKVGKRKRESEGK